MISGAVGEAWTGGWGMVEYTLIENDPACKPKRYTVKTNKKLHKFCGYTIKEREQTCQLFKMRDQHWRRQKFEVPEVLSSRYWRQWEGGDRGRVSLVGGCPSPAYQGSGVVSSPCGVQGRYLADPQVLAHFVLEWVHLVIGNVLFLKILKKWDFMNSTWDDGNTPRKWENFAQSR